ncbi:hypothetical protein AGMMS50233_08890 [Endomicrobiia bacterium]|nr:hypothetical protein AGMMS50233_08890 [Endomicrobiia bacterium]
MKDLTRRQKEGKEQEVEVTKIHNKRRSKMRNITMAIEEIIKFIKGKVKMKFTKGEMNMENVTISSVLKKLLRAEMKKIVTAIIIFGMIISPAVNAMADPHIETEAEQLAREQREREERERAEREQREREERERAEREQQRAQAAAPAEPNHDPVEGPAREPNAQAKNEQAQGTALVREDVSSLSSSSDTDSSSGSDTDSDTDNDSLDLLHN